MNERMGVWAMAMTLAAAGVVLGGCKRPAEPAEAEVSGPAQNPIQYPQVARGEQVDDYHGTSVGDPYRWLESLDSAETRQFVEAQNAVSRPYIDGLPGREKIKALVTKLWNYERFGVPVEEQGRYFYTRNDGLQNQAVIHVADKLDAEPRVLLDPNTLSSDGTVAVQSWSVSPDGGKLLYLVSDGGTDWKTVRVRDVATGKDLAEEIRHVKFSEPSWLRDSTGFYYSSYPLDAAGKGDDSKQPVIHLHQLGKPQSADARIYAITDHPKRVPEAILTEDGRYLIIDVFQGYDVNGVYYFDLKKKQAKPVRLFDDWKALNTFIGNRGSELLFKSTTGAPNARVIAVDVGGDKPKTRVIAPEGTEALVNATFTGGKVFAQYLKDAHSVVRIHDFDGSLKGEVKLPGSGAAAGFAGHADSTETFFSYSDFLTPGAIYRYDIAQARSSVFRQPKVPVDTSRYLTEQVFYKSKDGTRVPMFITRRKDVKLDGANPVQLYGYGGFAVALTPGYSTGVMSWLELGGIYAVANLRGGNEYGEAWHEAGTKSKKQNVFDDFIGAAEYLIANKYTSPKHLGISGRSNGGLLVGAAITQRPDLFGAALPGVGVLDMLRYHTASANAYQWSSDYGLSESAEDFPALYRYSPYQVADAKQGACYPPTLISTADHDDRVVPWHSYKFASALQHSQTCNHPVLLTVETRAGHGAGKPTWKQIQEMVENYAFLGYHLGMKL